MIEIREYLDAGGYSPYAKWFDGLNPQAAAKVVIAVTRMGHGNLSNSKRVGAGVHECRIEFGPGYRVYFGREGDRFVILLGGGTKKRQQGDIRKAQALWRDYKARKRRES
jgi:putative addiction module killer protein